MKARIIGQGSYLPVKVLSNADLEKIVETSDEWIFTRTGMKERRIASKEEFTSTMGVKAAKKAMEEAQIAPEAIDFVLFATITPDYVFPSTACLLQKELGLVNAAAMDIQATCTGYLYAIAQAKAYIEAGMYRNILVVAAEKLSSITDYTDRNTCVLFGDGAAACVVSDQGPGLYIKQVSLGCDGEQANLVKLPAGGSRQPTTKETVEERQHYIQMDGKEVFKHAVRRMESAAKTCIENAGMTEGDIHWLVPHQANVRIIDAIGKRFSIPKEKVFLTLQKYGNTSASAVGIALDELVRDHNIADGENLLLVAFGGGLTWGAAILEQKEA